MRLALALTLLAALTIAGSAAASDYMLPLLLEGKKALPAPGTPGGEEPAAATPQSAFVSPGSPATMIASLLGAAVVVAATMMALGRVDKRGAKRAAR
jgi:hypothetical protein